VIDVSILRQTLVAFEGTRPVYATLVSTGVDGLGDPEKTHSTVLGVFQVHTKHVAATMDGDDVATSSISRRALRAVLHRRLRVARAYWHDEFGTRDRMAV